MGSDRLDDSTFSSLLIAEFQECAPSTRAKLLSLVRMGNLLLLTGENLVHHRAVRPIAQTSALVAVELAQCRKGAPSGTHADRAIQALAMPRP